MSSHSNSIAQVLIVLLAVSTPEFNAIVINQMTLHLYNVTLCAYS